MEERIILAPGANASELLRTLAKNGINTMGWRIAGPVELAKTTLMRAGISVTDDFITRREEPSVIFSFLNEIDHFSAASFADAESLAAALDTARGLITEDEDSAFRERLGKGTFKAKNDAICEVYERYMDWCDEHARIDSIGLVRKAAEEAADKAHDAAKRLGGAEYFSLREYPLTPLERSLLTKLSGGSLKETDLAGLCGLAKNDTPDISFTEAYGHINEAENIIADIYGNGRPLDSCVIACANPSQYAQIFRDMSCRYGIPLTYGSGVPILNANPARLLKLVYAWKTTGYCGVDALRDIFLSEAFDRGALANVLGVKRLRGHDLEDLAVMAGELRLSMDDASGNAKKLRELGRIIDEELDAAKKAVSEKGGPAGEEEEGKEKEETAEDRALRKAEHRKKIFGMCCVFAEELSKGLEHFIEEYSKIRGIEDDKAKNAENSADDSAKDAENGDGSAADADAAEDNDIAAESAGRIDRSALNVISELISSYTANIPDGNVDEIIPDILNKTVSSESSRAGCIHVTSIKGALASMRKNFYVCGLSAGTFPGSPAENYLLLDEDLTLLADGEKAPTSDEKISLKKQQLMDAVGFAAATGARISLSYPGYSLSELAEQNPSSILFEIFEKVYGDSTMDDFRNKLEYAGYFGNGIGTDRAAGESYINGFGIKPTPAKAEKTTPEETLKRAWSPSALEQFMHCPRRFYLENVLGIRQTEEDDPFTVLSAAVTGNIAHEMMEAQGEHRYPKEDFLRLSGEAFDRALAERPPMHPADAEKARKEFLDMMSDTYDMDPGDEVLSAEQEYVFDHPSGIKVHGFPDRVQKVPGGNYKIVDFKTKRKIEHVENDFSTCMQVVVYAWLCEQAGIKIDGCEYWYTRLGRKVSCKYDDEMREELSKLLGAVKTAIETNTYHRIETKEGCQYCRFGDICGWKDEDSKDAAKDESSEKAAGEEGSGDAGRKEDGSDD